MLSRAIRVLDGDNKCLSSVIYLQKSSQHVCIVSMLQSCNKLFCAGQLNFLCIYIRIIKISRCIAKNLIRVIAFF